MEKLKILIADDEEMIRKLYEMILEPEFDCEFKHVENGKEAIDTLKSDLSFDLIICDYNMPVKNGGEVYSANKSLQNIPFLLFSGGEIGDYTEFNDFKESNSLNCFLSKPFNFDQLTDVVREIKKAKFSQLSKDEDKHYIKVKLSYYIEHVESSEDIFIKLGEDKFTKIINGNLSELPDKESLKHYLKKGIDYIFVERSVFDAFVRNLYLKFYKAIKEKNNTMSFVEIAGIKFSVPSDDLHGIGISSEQMSEINKAIALTLESLLSNSEKKDQFVKMCEKGGFFVGHSILTIYIAGRVLGELDFNFHSSMKKICTAAFYHDYSLFEENPELNEMNLDKISDDKTMRLLWGHPAASCKYLADVGELLEDTKKIILEHHEMPNGNGFPKKLTASQISPLSCLFILSEQITFCLLRNDFSKQRLMDFLQNHEDDFFQGNFSRFFAVAKNVFGEDLKCSLID